MDPVDLDDDENDGDKGRQEERRPHDYAADARAALHDKDVFSNRQMEQIARVAVEAIREVSGTAGEAKGQLTKSLSTVKVVLPIVAAIAGAAFWLIDVGERISAISSRSTDALKISSELRGKFDIFRPNVETLRFQAEASIADRASIRTQLAQNRDALVAQVEALRKDREQLALSQARTEAQLADVLRVLDRLENKRNGGSLRFPSFRDAQTPPPP